MSDILWDMSERLPRNPDQVHSPEAAELALMFSNIAWDECVGIGQDRPVAQPQ
jgi:hypothetical protein